MNLLVTFHSVSSALYAQKALTKAAVSCKVIPVPRSVSSSCGYAMEAMDISPSALTEAMEAIGAEWDTVYRVTLAEKGERYEPVSVHGNEGNRDA